jgi:hypothetical protein
MAVLFIWILKYDAFVRWYSTTLWWFITIPLILANLYVLLRLLLAWSELTGEEKLKLIVILLLA